MAAGSKESGLCGSCNFKVTNRTGGIKCNGFCFNWYHIKCTSFTKEEFKKFLELSDKVLWYCEKCKIEVNGMVLKRSTSVEDTKLDNDNEAVSPHLKLILDQLDTVSANYLKLEERMTNMEKSSQRNFNAINGVSEFQEDDQCINITCTEETPNVMDCNGIVVVDNNTNSNSVTSDNTLVPLKVADRSCAKSTSGNVNQNRNFNRPNSEWKVVEKEKGFKGLPKFANVRPSTNSGQDRPKNSGSKNGAFTGRPSTYRNSTNMSRPYRPSYRDVLKENNMKNKMVYGTKELSDSSMLKPAQRLFWLFVSGLDPSVSSDNIISYLKDLKNSESYLCEKLATRYSSYSSFKVGVPYDLNEELVHPNLWPEGCIIGKYKPPRNRAGLAGPSSDFLGSNKPLTIVT